MTSPSSNHAVTVGIDVKFSVVVFEQSLLEQKAFDAGGVHLARAERHDAS